MLNDKQYTRKEYDLANMLVGAEVYFFIRRSVPNHLNQSVYSYFPMMIPDLVKTKVTGVSADVKKISDQDGERDEYRKLCFILSNPYYVKPEEPEEGMGGGFPKCDHTSYKEWSLSYETLNQWFFETKEIAMSIINESRGGYYQP